MKKALLLPFKPGILPEPGSITHEIAYEGHSLGIIIVRHSGQFYAYVNRCPHVGTPLDWEPGKVLSLDLQHILCATHGACFRIQDGVCISGPCAGDQLTPLPLTVRDDSFFINLPE